MQVIEDTSGQAINLVEKRISHADSGDAERKEERIMPIEHWKEEPDMEDYPSAVSYLTLLVGRDMAKTLVKTIRKSARLAHFAAKDILRAAGLPLLGTDDSEVAKDLEKVKFGAKLSPVLLIQGNPLWIADGYHRVCASYHLDEKAWVPCRITPRSA